MVKVFNENHIESLETYLGNKSITVSYSIENNFNLVQTNFKKGANELKLYN